MGNSLLTTVGPLILFFAIFYFLAIRPQQKRQKQTREMQAALKKGDKIVTIGGFHGTVDAIDEDRIVIRSNDGSKLTFDRQAVREITESKEKE
ncbi:MAG TPA: preprotein translocase subunit YajC [Bacillales bacterium]|nr:preprotein translocase subunit YajC [Bacillales bacterium]